jgi:hypothetical protein
MALRLKPLAGVEPLLRLKSLSGLELPVSGVSKPLYPLAFLVGETICAGSGWGRVSEADPSGLDIAMGIRVVWRFASERAGIEKGYSASG